MALAQSRSQTQRPLLSQEQLKKKLEVSNFHPNAILRGVQLTIVGGQFPLTGNSTSNADDGKLTGRCRILRSSHPSTINKLLLLLL